MKRILLILGALLLAGAALTNCAGLGYTSPPALVFPTYTAGFPTLPPRGSMPTPTLPLVAYRGQSYAVSSIAWSPNGKRVVSGAWDGSAQVWDATSGHMLLTYRVSARTYGGPGVTAVAWSPDGTRIASAIGIYGPNVIEVWNASTGQTLMMLTGHTAAITALAWSPDGARLASASVDATVRIWDVRTGKLLLTYRGHKGAVNALAWSRDGSRMVSGSNDKTAQVWDARNGKTLVIYHNHTDEVFSVAWSPDGRRVVSASQDATAQVWDTQSGKPLIVYKSVSGSIQGVAWSPDSNRIASLDSGMLEVWNANSGANLFTYGVVPSAVALAWSPDSKLIALAGGLGGDAEIWSAA